MVARKQSNSDRDGPSLRKRAEGFINAHPETGEAQGAHAMETLIEELRVHQVELEMQNEELRRAQLELQMERDKYSDLYDFSPVGYFTVSGKGVILDANLTCAALLGMDRGALKTTPLSSYVHREDQDAYYLSLQALKERRERQVCELRLRRRDGSFFYADMECISVLDDHQNVKEIRGAITDITQRKQAEEKIQDYHCQLKRFASELTLTEERLKTNVATHLHDSISQSLVAARMELNQLKASMTDPKKQTVLDHTIFILGQILEESQSLTDQLSYPILNVMGLSRAVEEWLRREVGNKHGLRVCFSDDGLDKPLHEDVKAVLFRSIREVLNNVVKHALARAVTVRIQRSDLEIVVSISDDGVGFDPQVFKARGSGFGLLSIQESLERLEGHLDIESSGGTGSQISLRLPLRIDEPVEAGG